MQSKPTDELNSILENAKPSDIDEYLRENKQYMAGEKKSFYFFFKDTLDDKGIKLKDVYSFAGVSESYGGRIIRQEGHARDRDLIIRLCIAGHFNLQEINSALKIYGLTELYPKDPRDVVIIVAINNRIYDLSLIDDMLSERGLDPITSEVTEEK